MHCNIMLGIVGCRLGQVSGIVIMESESVSCSVVSDSLRPHGL